MLVSCEMKLLGLDKVFSSIKGGDYHAASQLDAGDVPLISSTEADCGVLGYYAIPESKTYRNVVTIAANGGPPLSSFFHPYKMATKDDVLVCVPRDNADLTLIYYTVAYLNSMRWRFSWSRKCYEKKAKKIQIAFPVDSSGEIDREALKQYVKVPSFTDILPKRQIPKVLSPAQLNVVFRLDTLFHLERGDFHSITKLEEGEYSTVSRIATNNGIVGHFKKPSKAHVYPPSLITVSTVAGDAFLQTGEFISTDNVVILVPRFKTRLTTLYFIQAALNKMRWRYSYGRQCYKAKLAQVKIALPVNSNSTSEHALDEDFMERVVTKSSYWNYLQSRIHFVPVSAEDFEAKSGKKIKSDVTKADMPLEVLTDLA